jgi:hypothetical protein
MKESIDKNKLAIGVVIIITLIVLAFIIAVVFLGQQSASNSNIPVSASQTTSNESQPPSNIAVGEPNGSTTGGDTGNPTPATTPDPKPNPPTSNASAVARNSQRSMDVNVILNAITMYKADNDSISGLGTIPTCPETISIGTAPTSLDLEKSLVPSYLSEMPKDPTNGTPENIGYSVCTESEKITVSAPNAELGKTISATR